MEKLSLLESKAYVRVTKGAAKSEPITIKDEQINFEPVPIAGTPEVVSVSLGLTMNLGNFESARIDIFRSIPVAPSEENANTAFDVCKNWVSKRIEEEVKSARGEKVLDSKSKFNDVKGIF